MKSILNIVFCFVALTSISQDWKDTVLLGEELYNQQKFDQAFNKFSEAHKRSNDDVSYLKQIGKSAYQKGDYSNASTAFEQALNNAQSTQEKAKLHHNIGNCYLKQKDYAAAIENYKIALRNNPNDEKTRYNLAEAKRRLKKQQEQNPQKKDQQKQNKQNNQNNKNQQNKGGKQNQKSSGEQNNSQQNGNSSSQQEGGKSPKLSSKKTERLLDEISKREMETKRYVRSGKNTGGKNAPKSGKKW